MIHEIDDVLRSLIRKRAMPEVITDVEFAPPTRDWAARLTGPAVNLFLYDIREEVSRRERGRIPVRGPGGEVVRVEQPPRWFRLSYLATAWTSRSEDEHRVLSALLVLLMRHEVLPADELTPGLAAHGLAIPMAVAMPPSESRSFSDLWSALGGDLKPSLDVVVVAPLSSSPEHVIGPPVTEDFTLGVHDTGGTASDVAVRSFREERESAAAADEGAAAHEGAGAHEGTAAHEGTG